MSYINCMYQNGLNFCKTYLDNLYDTKILLNQKWISLSSVRNVIILCPYYSLILLFMCKFESLLALGILVSPRLSKWMGSNSTIFYKDALWK